MTNSTDKGLTKRTYDKTGVIKKAAHPSAATFAAPIPIKEPRPDLPEGIEILPIHADFQSIGDVGPAGAPGSQWLVGVGTPGDMTGNVNDLYLDLSTYNFYRKTADGWGTALGNLRGPIGPAGPVGPVGSTGPGITIGITGADFVVQNSPVTGTGLIRMSLAAVNNNVGTYNGMTVNAKGLVTAASVVHRSAGIFVEVPYPKSYTVVGRAPTAGNIVQMWSKTRTGTLSASVQINGTPVTGLSNVSVTNSGTNTAATAANSFNAGDRITVIIAYPDAASDFEMSLDVI